MQLLSVTRLRGTARLEKSRIFHNTLILFVLFFFGGGGGGGGYVTTE